MEGSPPDRRSETMDPQADHPVVIARTDDTPPLRVDPLVLMLLAQTTRAVQAIRRQPARQADLSSAS